MSLNLLGVFHIIILRWQQWQQRRWYNCCHRIVATATTAAAAVINDITKFMGTLEKHLCISRLIQVDTYVRLFECECVSMRLYKFCVHMRSKK